MDEKTLLEHLNRFTRREHTAEEVYIFPVTLCDNEIDRDNERFSREALDELAEKFVGVTGIFDHNPKGENQTARLFMTEVVKEDRMNSLGEKYASLRGYAYMVRTDSNDDLIREIDGGIKKEVSVSCSAEKQICSICGADRREKPCRHVKGKKYGRKLCFFTLEDISDVYEWSFVAVPAQIRAGVTKSCSVSEKAVGTAERSKSEAMICRVLMLKNPDGQAKKLFGFVKDFLGDEELEELCRNLSAENVTGNCDEYKM
ncbi:MAG: hypothetical protein IJZ61_08510 [Oscillospiraceae bacterium]|nr:hypothetical protein [Oscillospiraceae bacterium]